MKNIIFLGIIFFVSMPITGYSNNMKASLTWQSQSADLDLYIFNPEKAVCNWSHNNTAWGCRYDSESRGGRNAQDTLPYTEKATINLANSPVNAGAYTVLAYYHDWQDESSPRDVQASVDIHHHGELVGTFPIRLAKPGDQVIVWQNVIGDKSTSEQVVPLYSASSTILDNFNNPITGVTIEINGKTTITDENGHWELNELAAGDYLATASKKGYRFEAQNFAVGNGQNAIVTFKAISLLNIKVLAKTERLEQGDNVTYTITVTNEGAEMATDVALTQTLPEGTTLVSLTPLNGGQCDTETMTCTLPELSAGSTAKVQLVVSNTEENERLQMTTTLTSNEYPTDVQMKQTSATAYFSVATACSPETIMPQNELNCTATVQLSEYAASAATDVKLTVTLPQGVQVNSETLDNRCESTPTTLTCVLEDLVVPNSGETSQTVVNFTETLLDPGLLLLTHQVQVTANEYPMDTKRVRTKIYIPPEYQVDMVLVIDVTGSMQEEMDGAKEALTNFVNEVNAANANQFPLSVLIVFRDEVTVTAVTKDMEVLINAIGEMEAAGGGMCPEASAEALEVAIRHVKPEGIIALVTDASPYDDADLVALTKALKNKAIKFNSFITGDCSNQESWNALPNQQ